MSEPKTAFADVPISAFPFVMDFLNTSGEVVHSITVTGAGAVHIPGLADLFGPITVRVTYADRSVETYGPAE
jgi:hypothetical protein